VTTNGHRPTSPQAIVEAVDLWKRYGEGDAAVDALAGVSMAITRGTFTAVMGPSGSGKSTLMHLVAGLDRPTKGTVYVDGTDLSKLNDKHLTQLRRKTIGFVFQRYNLLPTLSAEENIRLPVSLAGGKTDPEWFDQLLETTGLTERRTHRPSQLSGGQQQRVAVARALVSKPACIFADEPTGNLDTASGDEVLSLLRRSVDTLNQTVMMVTHDPHAASYADRLVVLRDGQIVHDGASQTSEQILDLMKTVAA
jgi:putative ABC transport system ATP-binding protein